MKKIFVGLCVGIIAMICLGAGRASQPPPQPSPPAIDFVLLWQNLVLPLYPVVAQQFASGHTPAPSAHKTACLNITTLLASIKSFPSNMRRELARGKMLVTIRGVWSATENKWKMEGWTIFNSNTRSYQSDAMKLRVSYGRSAPGHASDEANGRAWWAMLHAAIAYAPGFFYKTPIAQHLQGIPNDERYLDAGQFTIYLEPGIRSDFPNLVYAREVFNAIHTSMLQFAVPIKAPMVGDYPLSGNYLALQYDGRRVEDVEASPESGDLGPLKWIRGIGYVPDAKRTYTWFPSSPTPIASLDPAVRASAVPFAVISEVMMEVFAQYLVGVHKDVAVIPNNWIEDAQLDPVVITVLTRRAAGSAPSATLVANTRKWVQEYVMERRQFIGKPPQPAAEAPRCDAPPVELSDG